MGKCNVASGRGQHPPGPHLHELVGSYLQWECWQRDQRLKAEETLLGPSSHLTLQFVNVAHSPTEGVHSSQASNYTGATGETDQCD